MATAKTYKDWKKVSKPFEENKKFYIMVENPKTLKEKKVRFYFDPIDTSAEGKANAIFSGNDYILTIPEIGMNDKICSESLARYSTRIGWYFISPKDKPCDFPYQTNLLYKQDFIALIKQEEK